jgi:hypothetical protein
MTAAVFQPARSVNTRTLSGSIGTSQTWYASFTGGALYMCIVTRAEWAARHSLSGVHLSLASRRPCQESCSKSKPPTRCEHLSSKQNHHSLPTTDRLCTPIILPDAGIVDRPHRVDWLLLRLNHRLPTQQRQSSESSNNLPSSWITLVPSPCPSETNFCRCARH